MDGFASLAIVLGLAAVGGLIARLFKQPALLGYIVAGVIINLLGWMRIPDVRHMIELMGQVGVTLLLFLVGLEMSSGQLKQLGKVALATGIGQIVFTAALGYLLALALGIDQLGAMYLAIAMTFSSTIIVIKLLSEKRDLQSLYGKIAVGFLLVQDFVAIGLLIVLSGFAGGGLNPLNLLMVLVKGIVLVSLAIVLSNKVLPRFMDLIGKSSETLFITALGWCLGVAALVASPWIGFRVEIGGFLAGFALSAVSEHLQIAARVRPLRDFFLTLFFVFLGANITFSNPWAVLIPAVALSIFVLVGKPLVVMVIMGVMGYRRRTAFLTGLTTAQISEFSLVLMAVASGLGHVTGNLMTITAVVGVITMTTSTYLIVYSDFLYEKCGKWLKILERSKPVEIALEKTEFTDHVVLVGHNRTGKLVLPALKKLDLPLLIVDFNPMVVEELKSQGLTAVYGDIGDEELYELINLSRAKVVVSTASDIRDSEQIVTYLSSLKKKPLIITAAVDHVEARQLYKLGADYVLVPHAVGGDYLAHIFNHHGLDLKYLEQIKQNDLRNHEAYI